MRRVMRGLLGDGSLDRSSPNNNISGERHSQPSSSLGLGLLHSQQQGGQSVTFMRLGGFSNTGQHVEVWPAQGQMQPHVSPRSSSGGGAGMALDVGRGVHHQHQHHQHQHHNDGFGGPSGGMYGNHDTPLPSPSAQPYGEGHIAVYRLANGRIGQAANGGDADPFTKPSFSDFMESIPDLPGTSAPHTLEPNTGAFSFFPADGAAPPNAGTAVVLSSPPISPTPPHSNSPFTSGYNSHGQLSHSQDPGHSLNIRAAKSRRASVAGSDFSGAPSPSPGLSPTNSLLKQFSAEMSLRYGGELLGQDGSQSDTDKKQTTRDKNREAQRRYREKQRTALAVLQVKTDEQRKVIDGLVREKRMVEEHNRVLLERVWQLEGLVEQLGGNIQQLPPAPRGPDAMMHVMHRNAAASGGTGSSLTKD